MLHPKLMVEINIFQNRPKVIKLSIHYAWMNDLEYHQMEIHWYVESKSVDHWPLKILY
jgi:hypothetical protein